jgi:hypothetical protein
MGGTPTSIPTSTSEERYPQIGADFQRALCDSFLERQAPAWHALLTTDTPGCPLKAVGCESLAFLGERPLGVLIFSGSVIQKKSA